MDYMAGLMIKLFYGMYDGGSGWRVLTAVSGDDAVCSCGLACRMSFIDALVRTSCNGHYSMATGPDETEGSRGSMVGGY